MFRVLSTWFVVVLCIYLYTAELALLYYYCCNTAMRFCVLNSLDELLYIDISERDFSCFMQKVDGTHYFRIVQQGHFK